MTMSILSLRANWFAFSEVMAILRRHFELTWEMTKRELTDRYAGQAIGAVWTIGHPLIQTLVYVYIFTFVFAGRMTGFEHISFDYTTYMLAGLVPWLTFNEVLSKSTQSIVGNANLVKQLVFPLEILPVKTVWASLLAQLVGTACMLLYVLIACRTLSWMYILLPVLIAFQMLLMIGMAFLLGSFAAYFRDIKEFVQIFAVISIYLLPIVYHPSMVPPVFQPFLYVNPFSYMIWCYQDVCYYGSFEHLWAWPVFLGMSLFVFTLGYRTFRKLKPYFGNVL